MPRALQDAGRPEGVGPAIEQRPAGQTSRHGAVDLETSQPGEVGRTRGAPPRRSSSWQARTGGGIRHDGADGSVSRPCALSSRQDRPGVAIPTRTTDRAAFRFILLPPSQPHRAVMGADPPASHAQQKPIRHVGNSPTQYSPSSATRSPGDGANFAIRSQTTSASSSPRNFDSGVNQV